MNNLAAIIGRPNVGKSSLFNMMVGKRKSIVHNQSGITRDRLYGEVIWTGKKIKIIDTGGIKIENKKFQNKIEVQVKIAIEEATVIIFVVDGIQELTSDDLYIIRLLRQTNKPILLAANKLEGNKKLNFEIYSLGIKNIFPISAIHGEGIGELLDKTLQFLNFSKDENYNFPRLSIIGRPNVGKSSLVNTILGKKRSIVSSFSGTTRDSVDSKLKINNDFFIITDTAGINKKSKLSESVEHFALSRAMNSIIDSNIIILVIDSEREISHFDLVVGGYAYKKWKPIIIVINKWDLFKKNNISMDQKQKILRKKFQFFSWVPIVFVSAKTSLRINKLKDKIIEININRKKEIKTNVLNEVLNEIQILHPAHSHNGGKLNIKFVRQIKNDIPKFLLWVNNLKYLHFSYERFLENKFREYFNFEGTPIKFVFKNSKEKNDKKR